MADTLPSCGVVIYTDGSARPNPGFYGSGLHGYAFRFPGEKEQPTKANSLTATTRGYLYQQELAQKADAKPVIVTEYLDSFSASLESGTNNVAEVNAISLFFEHYPDLAEQIDTLHVIADSQYAINGATTWLDGWIRNNWITSTGAPVNNREAWERLSTHLKAFKARATFTMEWVRGHNDNFGNVKADYLAGIATNHSTDKSDTSYLVRTPPTGYHKGESTIHPFLGLKRIYFNTDAEFNTPGIYYQTGWAGPSFILGKRTSEAAFSVVKLLEPDATLESIVDAQCRVPVDVNGLVYMKLERLRSADVFPFIRDHGRFCLTPDPRNLNMNFLDRKPITIEVRPGELPLRAIDTLNHLEEILERFNEAANAGDLKTFEEGSANYHLHDITDHFYDKIEKKVGKTTVQSAELKKTFVVGIKKTEIIVEEQVRGTPRELKLPLIFMDDIPARNTLKRLETLHPNVYFVTWRESDHALRYATVIKTDDAVGIWSNYFANQLIL